MTNRYKTPGAHQRGFVHLPHARGMEQKEVMERIAGEGVCPFCLENLARFHAPPTIKEGIYWVLTPNQWPYENTRLHLLAIYKQHAETLADLAPEAGQELFELAQWVEKKYDLQAGALGLRFGNPAESGGSIHHLHVQLLTADITYQDDPDYKPVRIKIC